MIVINSKVEIELMKKACQNAAKLLKYLGEMIKPGITTEEIDQAAVKWAEERGLIHAPFNYTGHGLYPFPKSICTSVNDCICHGIPSKNQVLKEGDIVNVDVSPITDGWHGDTSKTFTVGQVSSEAEKLVKVTEECLVLGTQAVKPGGFLGDIGAAIMKHAQENGFSVVREFVGHGIGRKFHTAPTVTHFGIKGKGIRLRPGMIFTIEPMINAGKPDVKMVDDWIAHTKDGSLSAQFEWTVLVTETGFEILTVVPPPKDIPDRADIVNVNNIIG